MHSPFHQKIWGTWLSPIPLVQLYTFSLFSYHHILPTLALLYSHHENNEIVSNAVEVGCFKKIVFDIYIVRTLHV